jgi:hypothetical protein
MMKGVKDVLPKCAECECSPGNCRTVVFNHCSNCSKEKCCCLPIHKSKKNTVLTFFYHTKTLFAAALGIEILCISSAIIGENIGFYFFGYNLQGIILGYGLGYAAAGFTTFMTILGRYDTRNSKVDSCCSVLEQLSSKSLLSNLIWTFKNFGLGLSSLCYIHLQPQLKGILKTSLVILITAESVCILTAETIDLIFYNYSILLSIPLALLTGSFTVVAQEAYKKVKHDSTFSFREVTF